MIVAILNGFQFLMVRLKALRSRFNRAVYVISIPYGAIKSFCQQANNQIAFGISIPYGAIKRAFILSAATPV